MTTSRSIGVNFDPQGRARVRLWAPYAQKVALKLLSAGNSQPLEKAELGYWELTTDALKPGDHYWFQLDDEQELPDPASLSQPVGVHGPSQALDLTKFNWTDGDWKNPALGSYVIYELHTGTFTAEGTFEAIIEKLPHLRKLGVNAIELMPVAQFPGERNWGYDGVFPYAVQNSYGGAKGLMRLVDACHAHGLAVILDVVYNHFGPEGNYFPKFGPYFTDRYSTPWGKAINFDDAQCDEVRLFFLENALMWFRDLHIDALRLDAVHAIKDLSPEHILRALEQNVEHLIAATGKVHHLIIECDLNDRRFVEPLAEKGYGIAAQWSDEFHHALRVAAGGEKDGYYADFNGIGHLAKAYRDAYVYTGQYSPQRQKRFGTTTEGLAGDHFIIFSQNHDQVGNRMLGERSSQLFSLETQKLLAGAVMVAPYIPLLFMGEEWAAAQPFQYFVSHGDPELVKAVQEGRKAEFAAFHVQGEAPDPQSEGTFERSKLDWGSVASGQHRQMFSYYQALISLRKRIPALHLLEREQLEVAVDEIAGTLLLKRWEGQQQVCCLLNFSDEVRLFTLDGTPHWQVIMDSAAGNWGGPGAGTLSGRTASTQPRSLTIYANYHV